MVVARWSALPCLESRVNGLLRASLQAGLRLADLDSFLWTDGTAECACAARAAPELNQTSPAIVLDAVEGKRGPQGFAL